MKNIIESILEEFDKIIGDAPRTPNFLENKVCFICGQPYNKSEQVEKLKLFFKSSLQKAINAERERCLGCVPESWPPGEYNDCNCNMCWAFNKCRQETINKIKGE